MDKIDLDVAQLMNELHKREAERINARRKPAKPFLVDQEVWYRRPEGTGTKLDT